MVHAIVKVSKYRTFIERITWDTPNANALITLQRQTNIKVSFNDLNDPKPDFKVTTIFDADGNDRR